MDVESLTWFKLKQRLNRSNQSILFKEGEVWWCAIGLNVGSEENGKNINFERPVLVLRKFSKYLFLGVPMTTVRRIGSYYHTIGFKHPNSTLLLHQARTLSSFRLMRRIGTINQRDFEEAKDRFIYLMK